MKRLLIFASGTRDGGGSGFRNLVESTRTGVLNAQIVAVVSNHLSGGVYRYAERYGIIFIHMESFTAEDYQRIWTNYHPDLVSLSGWLKFVHGILRDMVNIHPGRLPDTKGLHSMAVHVEAIRRYKLDQTYTTAVTIQFVLPEDKDYDTGPIIFEFPVYIRPDDTPETLAARVNQIEHAWQPYITELVLSGEIRLQPAAWGQKAKVIVPNNYSFLPKGS